ncbi:hypothetical protein [Rhodospirillum sp. A1_3_36]|uniref:hypothetical protein n=1 Tax=Rhodospirillum sp. A1_3_36 TaxID=3391666 RepID=UPI0039A519A0
MRIIKKLFLYRERLYSNRPKYIESIEKNMYFLNTDEASFVASYLERGLIIIEFVSLTPDPYHNSDMVRNVVFSDGVYAWDGIILHWVKKYRIRLPVEFMRHIETSCNYNLPVKEEDAPELLDAYKLADPVWIK